MTFTVGGVDVTAVHVGDTPAEAVYLGSEKVWPTGPVVFWEGIIGPPTPYPPVQRDLPHGHITLRNQAGTHRYWSWWDAHGVNHSAEMIREIKGGTRWTLRVASGEHITFTAGAINMTFEGGGLVTDQATTAATDAFFHAHVGEAVAIYAGDVTIK